MKNFNATRTSKKWVRKTKRPQGLIHARKTKRAARALETIRNIESPKKIPKILTYVRKLDPFVFEELLLTVLDEAGYRIRRSQRYTRDGGCDGCFRDENNREILLQAKRYSSHIKPTHVKEFGKLVGNFNAYYGIFVHTGRTGPKSHISKPRNVTIISGNHLVRLLLQPKDTFLRR